MLCVNTIFENQLLNKKSDFFFLSQGKSLPGRCSDITCWNNVLIKYNSVAFLFWIWFKNSIRKYQWLLNGYFEKKFFEYKWHHQSKVTKYSIQIGKFVFYTRIVLKPFTTLITLISERSTPNITFSFVIRFSIVYFLLNCVYVNLNDMLSGLG